MRYWSIYVLVCLVRGYQLLFSSILGPRCRFIPTCSQYAIHALRSYGVIKGGWLALRRLMRCHPFNSGGLDPVPPVKSHRGNEKC